MEERVIKNQERELQRREKYRHRVLTILTIIGLWLALPATCGLIQRIVDTLTDLDFFNKNIAIAFKLITDTCLLGMYFVGFIILILVGFSGWALFSTWDWVIDTVEEKSPQLAKSYQSMKTSPKTQSILGWIRSRFSRKNKSGLEDSTSQPEEDSLQNQSGDATDLDTDL